MGGGLLNSLSINKTKVVLFLIIGIIIGSSIGVYAANKLGSNIVIYDNESTNASNVHDALDELFLRSNTISVKKDIDTNVEHGTNKDIVRTYFNMRDDSDVTCRVGNIEVKTTDDIAEKVGINDTYKVECSSTTGLSSINLKVANKLYLYKEGNEFTNITNGWIRSDQAYGSSGIVIKNAKSLYLQGAAGGNLACSGLAPNNQINLTSYNKLIVNVIASTQSSVYGSRGTIAIKNNDDLNFVEARKYELDLSSYNGSYTIRLWGYAGSGSITVDNIWLEM